MLSLTFVGQSPLQVASQRNDSYNFEESIAAHQRRTFRKRSRRNAIQCSIIRRCRDETLLIAGRVR